VIFGFAGGLLDRETGLTRFGARDYDPRIGRWTAKDPVDFASGETNRYSYAGSDPINQVDYDGRWVVPVAAALVGGTVNAFTSYIVGARAPGQLVSSFLLGASLAALTSVAPTSVVASAFWGGYAGAVGNLLGQAIDYGLCDTKFSLASLVSSTAVGALAGGVPAGLGLAAPTLTSTELGVIFGAGFGGGALGLFDTVSQLLLRYGE
jgi:RHS repeat-associated protein